MKYRLTITALVTSILLFSCVSSKKFKKSQADYAELQTRYGQLQTTLNDCNNAKAELTSQKSALETDKTNVNSNIADLNKQIDFLKCNNTTVRKQLQDMSVFSWSQAESIKKSLDNIGA